MAKRDCVILSLNKEYKSEWPHLKDNGLGPQKEHSILLLYCSVHGSILGECGTKPPNNGFLLSLALL